MVVVLVLEVVVLEVVVGCWLANSLLSCGNLANRLLILALAASLLKQASTCGAILAVRTKRSMRTTKQDLPLIEFCAISSIVR